jgi:hypothetical protein
MAKKKKTGEVASPTAGPRDKEYLIREDADRIKRYAEVKGDKQRHSAAMNQIRNEHKCIIDLDDSDENYEADEGRSTPRKENRKTSRRISRD